MNKKSYLGIVVLFLSFAVTISLYLWFVESLYFEQFTDWILAYESAFFISLVITKIAGIVWPPIPGGILTLGAIPVIGWWPAYLADFIGSMIGSSVAFYIGTRYGHRIVDKLLGPDMTQKVSKIKIKKHREVESIFLLRMFGGGTVMELVCYTAGLLKIRYRSFILGTFYSHILFGIPFYYFAHTLFDTKNILVSLILIVFGIALLSRLRKRYFHHE